jgi:hypothetical protein
MSWSGRTRPGQVRAGRATARRCPAANELRAHGIRPSSPARRNPQGRGPQGGRVGGLPPPHPAAPAPARPASNHTGAPPLATTLAQGGPEHTTSPVSQRRCRWPGGRTSTRGRGRRRAARRRPPWRRPQAARRGRPVISRIRHADGRKRWPGAYPSERGSEASPTHCQGPMSSGALVAAVSGLAGCVPAPDALTVG